MAIDYKYPNKISVLLAGRSQQEMSVAIGVTKGSVSHWVKGRVYPNRWIMPQVLAYLGEPWGRVLEESEVWPE